MTNKDQTQNQQNDPEFLQYIQAAEAFYNGSPIMSDFEYDELEKKVMAKYPDFRIKTYITFHQPGVSIQHHAHLPETNKSADEDRTYEVLSEFGDFITTKYDGCSIIAYYRDGEPYQIATRSDDFVGKNQFDKLINKVLHHVDTRLAEIYYEATTNIQIGDRSKANGLINSKYKQDEVDEYLTLNPFGCWSEDKDAAREFMQQNVKLISKEEMDYIISNGMLPDGTPADGVVSLNVDENSLLIRKIYNNGAVNSKITGHRVTFSDTTMLQSVVNQIEKVQVDGANISNVKMGPITTIKKLGLGIGAEVEVIRTKKVIPYISKVLKPSDNFLDVVCCGCGREMIVVGQDLYCTNPNCEMMNNAFLERLRLLDPAKIADYNAHEVFLIIRIPRFDMAKKIPDFEDFNQKVIDTKDLIDKIACFEDYCSSLQKTLIQLYAERISSILPLF